MNLLDRCTHAVRLLDQSRGPAVLGSGVTRWAIEIFPGVGVHKSEAVAWVTFWVNRGPDMPEGSVARQQLIAELQSLWRPDALPHSAVVQWRVKSAPLSDCETLWGVPPADDWVTHEEDLQFITRFEGVKHPGIFLDHAPLRQWLVQNARGLNVLNTFAYTGSLSVAAQHAGAAQICTVDLSRATIEWAKKNAALVPSSAEHTAIGQMDFWAADVMEWLPRTAKRIQAGLRPAFDLVILDPPSFSRSKGGVFSTEKDTAKLHAMALDVMPATGGWLVSSVNSEFITQAGFVSQILETLQAQGRSAQVVQELTAPDPFPRTQIKGAIFRVAPG